MGQLVELGAWMECVAVGKQIFRLTTDAWTHKWVLRMTAVLLIFWVFELNRHQMSGLTSNICSMEVWRSGERAGGQLGGTLGAQQAVALGREQAADTGQNEWAGMRMDGRVVCK